MLGSAATDVYKKWACLGPHMISVLHNRIVPARKIEGDAPRRPPAQKLRYLPVSLCRYPQRVGVSFVWTQGATSACSLARMHVWRVSCAVRTHTRQHTHAHARTKTHVHVCTVLVRGACCVYACTEYSCPAHLHTGIHADCMRVIARTHTHTGHACGGRWT